MRWSRLSRLAQLHRHRSLVIAVGVVVVLIAVLGITLRGDRSGHDTAPVNPPAAWAGGGIDLGGWKLSIPEENDDGGATSIEPATTKAPWLSATPDGGLMFWAPTVGATTDNSEHPRTELQSLTTFSAGAASHTLSASLTLLQLPRDGRGVIVGQIHGAQNLSSVPYVMLRVQKGQLRVVVKQVQDGDDLIDYPLLAGVGLNSRIDYTITDFGNGSMAFTATNNGVTRQASAPVPAAFYGATVRFQAGDYQQANDSDGTQDGARVIFHRLVQQ